MTRKLKDPENFGKILIENIPRRLIARLNKIASDSSTSRTKFLKSELFKIADREEQEKLNNK